MTQPTASSWYERPFPRLKFASFRIKVQGMGFRVRLGVEDQAQGAETDTKI